MVSKYDILLAAFDLGEKNDAPTVKYRGCFNIVKLQIPELPSFFLGHITLEDQSIPVIDPAACFTKATEITSSSSILLVKRNYQNQSYTFAVVIWSFDELMALAANCYSYGPESTTSTNMKFVIERSHLYAFKIFLKTIHINKNIAGIRPSTRDIYDLDRYYPCEITC